MAPPWSMVRSSSDRHHGDMDDGNDDDTDDDDDDTDDDTDDDHDDDDTDDDNDHKNDSYTSAGAAPGASAIKIRFYHKEYMDHKTRFFPQPNHILVSKDRSASQKLSF